MPIFVNKNIKDTQTYKDNDSPLFDFSSKTDYIIFYIKNNTMDFITGDDYIQGKLDADMMVFYKSFQKYTDIEALDMLAWFYFVLKSKVRKLKVLKNISSTNKILGKSYINNDYNLPKF